MVCYHWGFSRGLLKTWIKQEVKQLLAGCTCWKPTSDKIAAAILFKEFIREPQRQVCSNFILSFNVLIILSLTKTEDRLRHDRLGGLFVALSCFVSSSAGLCPRLYCFLQYIVTTRFHPWLPSCAVAFPAVEEGFGDKSRRSRGVPGKP